MAKPKTFILIPHIEKEGLWYESKELIRCHDCKSYIPDIKACMHLNCSANPEGYCSDGKRRDESDDE